MARLLRRPLVFSLIAALALFSFVDIAQASPTTYLVVPCYNEELRLPVEKFEQFLKDPANKDVFVLFVNDGSDDGTLDMLAALAKQHHSVDVLNLHENSGKAEAVRQGMGHVMVRRNVTREDVVGFWDADLATPLETVRKFTTLFRERPHLEMVFGARVALLGRDIHRKIYRHYLGRIFATLASIVLNLRIYDTQCGAKLFRATPELTQVLDKPFLTNWIFDIEIIARFIRLRKGTDKPPIENVVYEYPLDQWEDIAGSKLAFLSMAFALYGLVKIWFTYFGPGQDIFAVTTTVILIVVSSLMVNRWMKR